MCPLDDVKGTPISAKATECYSNSTYNKDSHINYYNQESVAIRPQSPNAWCFHVFAFGTD